MRTKQIAEWMYIVLNTATNRVEYKKVNDIDGYIAYINKCAQYSDKLVLRVINEREEQIETWQGNINSQDELIDISVRHTKRCKRCGQIKHINMYSKQKGSADGLLHYCKDCKSLENKTRPSRKKTTDIDNVERVTIEGQKLCKVHAHVELATFTARQLMEELKARGYRWDYMIPPQKKITFDSI